MTTDITYDGIIPEHFANVAIDYDYPEEDPAYIAFLESLNYEDCPKHGKQKVVRDDVTGGSDPYAIVILECKDRVIDFGDGNVIVNL